MKIIKNALINSVLAIAYIAIVASAIFNGEKLFGPDESIFVPIMMLSLLVFSVAMMGVLIFGRPVMWYLDGAKKEAIKLLFYTLGFILVALVIFLLVIIV